MTVPTTRSIERAVRARFTYEFYLRGRDAFLREREGAPHEPTHVTDADRRMHGIESETVAMFRSIGIELRLPGLSCFAMDRPDDRRDYYLALPGRQRVYFWTTPRPGHPEDMPDLDWFIRRAVEVIQAARDAPGCGPCPPSG